MKSALTLLAMILLASCGLFGASSETETPPETRVPVPTFTATVEVAAPTPTQPPATQPVEAAQPSQPEPAAAAPTNTEAPPTPTTAPATDTPAPKAQVVVTQGQINVRNGPGTEYGLAGSANQNDRFDVLSKNAAGDWWKVCCVNGQQVWIFGQLVSAENVANVAVDSNIPPPPVAQQPTPAPTQPAQPPAAQPTNTSAPPPPAASDPCAGIGGDGCKFHLKSGPSFAADSGELKLQLYFIHSGIEGGQPQGSYFVALFKDGQKLPISDAVRSIALEKNNGTLGQYNYEFTLQLGQIPGNNVAGNYSIFVLDGNGERDSKDFGFSVPDGQGLVYIVFDQG
ncbi:MAG: hypothetical protein U0175_27830 [Caldilineaceae bacterium]